MIHVIYVAMAVWLLIAAVLRIVLLLASGSDLDPLPFVSGALGLLGLLALLPAIEERRERRANPVAPDQFRD